jgi:hypothetical protein
VQLAQETGLGKYDAAQRFAVVEAADQLDGGGNLEAREVAAAAEAVDLANAAVRRKNEEQRAKDDSSMSSIDGGIVTCCMRQNHSDDP